MDLGTTFAVRVGRSWLTASSLFCFHFCCGRLSVCLLGLLLLASFSSDDTKIETYTHTYIHTRSPSAKRMLYVCTFVCMHVVEHCHTLPVVLTNGNSSKVRRNSTPRGARKPTNDGELNARFPRVFLGSFFAFIWPHFHDEPFNGG